MPVDPLFHEEIRETETYTVELNDHDRSPSCVADLGRTDCRRASLGEEAYSLFATGGEPSIFQHRWIPREEKDTGASRRFATSRWLTEGRSYHAEWRRTKIAKKMQHHQSKQVPRATTPLPKGDYGVRNYRSNEVLESSW